MTFGYDGGQLVLSQNSVQFDSSNFNQPITISVDAVADGADEEVLPYNITDYSMSGNDVWLAIWLGSTNWGWMQYNANTMLLEGDI